MVAVSGKKAKAIHDPSDNKTPAEVSQNTREPPDDLEGAYQSRKKEYYSLLKHSNHAKGVLRAFVGARTWLHERKRLGEDRDDYEAHVVAFSDAIADLHEALSSGRVNDQLQRSIAAWREEPGALTRRGNAPVTALSPIPSGRPVMNPNGRAVVSLFTGAFGLDLGFLAAGFNLRFANDIDKDCCYVAENNLPETPFFRGDIGDISMSEILGMAGLEKNGVDVLIGGPPCQPFSTAGRRQGLNDPRSSPLKAFVRAIEELQPRAFVMEEVTGLKSSRLQHVPYGYPEAEMSPEQKKGSAFDAVLEMLTSTGYEFEYQTLNAADFGTPQSRKRLFFIGLRKGQPGMPGPTHTSAFDMLNDHLKPWSTLWEATADLSSDEGGTKWSPSRAKYLELVPPGSHWRQLPDGLVAEAMGGAYHSDGGKTGFYRRLCWDEPSPTVVTSPVQKGSMFCHPEALRPLSTHEYKRVQGFPDDWELPASALAQYRLIGNAVPVHLSYSIAEYVAKLLT